MPLSTNDIIFAYLAYDSHFETFRLRKLPAETTVHKVIYINVIIIMMMSDVLYLMDDVRMLCYVNS